MKPEMKRRARELRKDQTDVEKRMWAMLRDKRLARLRFGRQQPIGPYIVDFFCPERKLVVELDGGQHSERTKEDNARDRFLGKAGYKVLRFWNNEFIENEESVLGEIIRVAESRQDLVARKPSPLEGEG